MHDIKLLGKGSGTLILFEIEFKISEKEICLYAGNFIKILLQLNSLYAKIQSNIDTFAYENNMTDYLKIGACGFGIGTNITDKKMIENNDWNGITELAKKFRLVAEVEKHHEERYRKLISNIESGLVFSRDGDKIWQCRNCGHIVVGKEAPKVCPVCAHPKAYFEERKVNY